MKTAIETYRIDQVHSTISFKVKHMMLNHSIGRFNEFDGEVHFDPHDLSDSNIQITIQAASIDTHHKDRDDHLKSPDFFDTARYPTITFNSKSVSKQLGRYVIAGDLNIKGNTKKVSLLMHVDGPVKDMQGQEVIGITGEIAINRKEFGILWDKTIESGKPVVDDNVKIDINIEAKK